LLDLTNSYGGGLYANFYLDVSATTTSTGSCFVNLVLLGEDPVLFSQTAFLVAPTTASTVPAPDFTVDNVLITNCAFISTYVGIMLQGNANFWEISFNYFDLPTIEFGFTGALIVEPTNQNYAPQLTGFLITNNLFDLTGTSNSAANSAAGVINFLAAFTRGNFASNTITSNIFQSNNGVQLYSEGIFIIEGWGNEISNNYFTNITAPLCLISTNLDYVSSNIFNEMEYPIDITSSTRITYVSNTFTKSFDSALVICASATAVLQQNIFQNNTFDVINQSQSTVFMDNQITTCQGFC